LSSTGAVWDLAWPIALGLGVVGFLVGLWVLRRLIRRGVPWWSSVAAPLLLFGPALALLGGARGQGLSATPGAEHWAANVAWSVLVFFGATAAFGLVRAFLQSRLVVEELGVRIPGLLLDTARYVLWIAMIFVVVGGIWNRTEWFGPLFTASAVGTVILGFALQETIANFFAGIGLVTDRVYGIGDWIWIGEVEGEIVAINRRSTRVRTRTNDVVTISNRMVVSSVVRNQSKPDPIHAEFLYVLAPYDVPPNHVKAVLRRAVDEVPKVLRTPPPVIRLVKFADSGVEYQVKIFLTDLAAIPDVKSDVMVQIWYHFRRAGITIPFPVREIRQGVAGPRESASPEAVLARLKSVPFFEPLSGETFALLARGARSVEFGARERVVQQGEAGDSCYVVDAGRVEVLVADGGAERQVAVLGPGDLFGEMSLLTGEPRTATVRTLEDARLVTVDAGTLGEVLQHSPELSHRLAEIATLRREGLLEARAALDAEARARVAASTRRLGELIRRFFSLPRDAGGRP
jgi:small-conductance mechanosensitive channel/CRP-like cAMP-binding protein